MKTQLLITIVVVLNSMFSFSQTRLSSETTLNYDQTQGGIPLNRFEVQNPIFNLKYDYKADLIEHLPVNDVIGLFIPEIISYKKFNLGGAFIKLGDWNQKDQLIVDLMLSDTTKHFLLYCELGRAIGVRNQPWDFVISRISHRLFTIEGKIMSSGQLFSSAEKTYTAG